MLTEIQKRQLDEVGYLALPGLMSRDMLSALRRRIDELFAAEGERAGWEFKSEPGARRLANLVNKGRIFREAMLTPEVLEAMAYVLGPDFKLSSINARDASPRAGLPQPLHADSGATADEHGYWVCNSVWMLDDFTADNGATRVVPGSHRWRRVPPAGLYERYPGERLITGKAGTVVVMNAHTWHGGTVNRTTSARRAVHIYYTRRDKPQQQYQKQWLSGEVQSALSAREREMLALDDPRNDELSLTGSGASGFMK